MSKQARIDRAAASVDAAIDLEHNRAKFFLTFVRPLSYREVSDL